MTKEIPILYSTPMVQAKLAGRKTMTRRIIKPKDEPYLKFENSFIDFSKEFGWVVKHQIQSNPDKYEITQQFKCPYGQLGDLHWVRENWQLIGWNFEDGEMLIRYEAGGELECDEYVINDDSNWLLSKVEHLEADGIIIQDPNNEERFVFTDKKQPWKPSIHMPKTAARIWEEVVSVRVERLQDISEADAIAEGVETLGLYPGYDVSAKGKFEGLWNLINGPESWEANPWVWVIETKTLSTTGKPLFKKLSDIETV